MLQQKPIDNSVLFIDMDAFFASAEQQAQPALRGRPVGVCPCLGDGCCVIASSYEAKRRGVKTGTRVDEAYRRCPDIVLVSDHPALYRTLHHNLMAILEQTYCQVVPQSIDEAYLIIPSYARQTEMILALVKGIKASIAQQLGEYIRCSIGIGPNIWLAKMAASHNKPNGLFFIDQAQLWQFYNGIPLLSLTGINYRFARRLYQLGIYNPAQFYMASYNVLTRAFGVVGQKWYLRLRGYEVDRIPVRPKQSIGHQTTLLRGPLADMDQLKTVITKLAYKVGRRLRNEQSEAHGVSLWLGYEGYGGWDRNLRQSVGFSSTHDILQLAYHLLKSVPEVPPVRRLGLTVYDLSRVHQLMLLEEICESRSQQLSHALDNLTDRYGTKSIIPASWLHRDIVPDRIGFGRGGV